jgi:serine/threonine protein kinase
MNVISRVVWGSDFTNVTVHSSGGCNSQVYVAKRNGEVVAIKMLKQSLQQREIAELEMSSEIHILTKITHPNIIKIKGAGNLPRKFIILEFLEGGTLQQALTKNIQLVKDKRNGVALSSTKQSTLLTISSCLSMARELASALKYLHDDVHSEAVVIHRDLKPQNIGFGADKKLKLFDFGLVSCVQRRRYSEEAYEMSGCTGTLYYMAPEVVLKQPYNEKVDVYSFSIILWQILSGGDVPYKGLSRKQYMERVVRDGIRPDLAAISTTGANATQIELLSRLLEQCWHVNPNERPRFIDILSTLDEMCINDSNEKRHNNPFYLWVRSLGTFFTGERENSSDDKDRAKHHHHHHNRAMHYALQNRQRSMYSFGSFHSSLGQRSKDTLQRSSSVRPAT